MKKGKKKMEEFPTDNLPYEKVGKNEPVCIADEVPFEIPESWEWARWGLLLNPFNTDLMHLHKKTEE